MKKISDYASEAEVALKASDFSGLTPATLYSPIEYALSAGGKRLRPGLLMMTAESFGGEAALNASKHPASGIEIFHNFTLLHDDVMDNSDKRRGRETVHAKWDVNTAILSGDTMLTLATREVCEVDDKILRNVIDTFNSMALEVYEGQRLDMDFETMDNIDSESYLSMVGKKTGALLGAASKIGALIGGASEKDANLMYDYGYMLGIAFQIQDDWLDTFGDTTTFGKPIGGDIVNNKKTFLLVKALETPGEDTEALRVAITELSGDAKVKAVTRIFEKMGMAEETRKEVATFGKKALKALKSTSLSDEAKEPYRLLIDKLTGRKK